LQALEMALRIHGVLKIKFVSGEPGSDERAAESPMHCRFLIADCRFDQSVGKGLI
jgi:hypothetical protein